MAARARVAPTSAQGVARGSEGGRVKAGATTESRRRRWWRRDGGSGGCRWCWRFKGDILNGWFPRRTRGLQYYPIAQLVSRAPAFLRKNSRESERRSATMKRRHPLPPPCPVIYTFFRVGRHRAALTLGVTLTRDISANASRVFLV